MTAVTQHIRALQRINLPNLQLSLSYLDEIGLFFFSSSILILAYSPFVFASWFLSVLNDRRLKRCFIFLDSQPETLFCFILVTLTGRCNIQSMSVNLVWKPSELSFQDFRPEGPHGAWTIIQLWSKIYIHYMFLH